MSDVPVDPLKEEMEMLHEEVSIINLPGWQRRLHWITGLFQDDSEKLTFGELKDDRLRMHAEGRCQAYKKLLLRDQEITDALAALRQEIDDKDAPEVLEGGDYPLSYEASK